MPVSRRAFLGWSGFAGYGTWALFRPSSRAKPPKPTTTTVAPTTTTTTTTLPPTSDGVYQNLYGDVY